MKTDFLIHYGILGMKWGVQRTPKQLRQVSEPSNRKVISDLSDEELQQRIDRINLERRYKDLVKPEIQKKSMRGKEFCEGLLKDIGNSVVKNLSKQILESQKQS